RLAEPEDGTLTSLTIRNSRAAYLCRTPDLRTLKTSTQGNTSGTGRSRTDSMLPYTLHPRKISSTCSIVLSAARKPSYVVLVDSISRSLTDAG
ncbi:hypothetical protein Moror_14572, partial [Moniliophthora roreri MCA 2997]